MYEACFGFDPPPFRLLPNPYFYLEDGQYGTILARLIQGLEAGEPCLLLTGPAGSGKTAAVQRLQMLLDPSRWTVGTMVASADVVGAGVLHSAVHALDLNPADGQPGHALDAGLSNQRARGGRTLLVIDEAEHLEEGALRQLAQRLAGTHDTPRLQLCLVGEQAPAGLAGALRDGTVPPLAVHCRLHALDASESRDYVLHRLRRAGWTGRPSFDRAATDAIHCRSQGIPRRIHLIADRVLLQLSIDAVDAATAAAVEAADDLRTVEFQGLAPIQARPAALDVPYGFGSPSTGAVRVGSADRAPELAAPDGIRAADHAVAAVSGVPAGRILTPSGAAADIRKTAAGVLVVALAGVGIGWWLGVGGSLQTRAGPASLEPDPVRATTAALGGGLTVPAGSVMAATFAAPLSGTARTPGAVGVEPAQGAERLRVFPPSPPCTPKHPSSSLQMLAIARAMAALCA